MIPRQRCYQIRATPGFFHIFSSVLLDKFPREAQNLVHFWGERQPLRPGEPSRLSLPPIWRSSLLIFWHAEISGGEHMVEILRSAWEADDGQDIAEYEVMFALILVIVVGTIRLIGSNANNVFSSTASSIK